MITLPPFKAFLASNIPSVYDNTLSYYDELVKLIAYLEQQVVPAVNKNTEDIEAYKNGLAELKDYVDHYFDNLDVQTEIDNKLDEMAEGGELAGIIAQFLTLAPVFGYSTIAAMAAADNLSNGCIARVIGDTSASDGDGAYYTIRTRVEADDPDGHDLVAIGDTLVGERIPDGTLNDAITTINATTSGIQAEIDLMKSQDSIFLGDSYAAGTTYESGSVQYLTSWCEYLRQIMGLTAGHYHIYAQGNAGFAKIGNNSMNFQMTLQSHLSEITNKNLIKNIFVCAGYNDNDQTTSLIYQRVGEFIAFCKTNFPNATVYIGMIGGNAADSAEGRTVRENLIVKVLNAYSRCGDFGGVYLTGVELFSHNFFQFNNQGNHPNEAGYKYVARMIYNAWRGGSTSVDEPITGVTLNTSFGDTIGLQGQMSNGTKTIYVDNYTKSGLTLSISDGLIILVPSNQLNKVVKAFIPGRTQIPGQLSFVDGSNNRHYAPCKLLIGTDGAISIYSQALTAISTVKEFTIWNDVTTLNMLNA